MTDVSVNGFWKAVRGSCVIHVIGLLGSPEELTGGYDPKNFYIDAKVVCGKLDGEKDRLNGIRLPRYFKGLIPTRPAVRLQVTGCATVCDNVYQMRVCLGGGWYDR